MSVLSVLIPAAGMGSRLGLGPKAWLEIEGLPLLVWMARKAVALTDEVWIAVAPADLEKAKQVCRMQGLPVHFIAGGVSRQATVLNLVTACQGKKVLIQDVARPFATLSLLRAVVECATVHGAAAAFLPLEVPTAICHKGWVVAYRPTSEGLMFQAPQVFERNDLLPVLSEADRHGMAQQSTLQLWLDAQQRICPVVGEKTNIKLTTPEDWVLAQGLKEYLKR
jgi:2-C-methyl-D-erythritol 4-phosphate cytidylyltransferase